MSTVSRGLPARPHLDVPKREARELLERWRTGDAEALERIQRRHPRFTAATTATIAAGPFRLSDAQLVIAREYTYPTWAELKRRIELNPASRELKTALRANDLAQVLTIVRAHPHLLHLHVDGANWGPPMSYAANLGHLEIIAALAALGARDFQHAFDRALLQGQIPTARWLHARGAKLVPGIVMGACETLNPEGLGFLAELGAPFTDEKGNRLAPLALVLGTYCRNPGPKHAVLEIFAAQGYALPDTPMMAFHRGRVDLLTAHLDRDPALLARRFTRREIYPPELGCADHDLAGMCGTPIAGTTLLHLAIDFDEQEIFDLLIARGVDVNARATVDAEGFGGHTPLFNAVISCASISGRQRDAAMARTLLARGADPTLRASVRKFLDWCETPGWHSARDVTAAGWARGFPEQNWINPSVPPLLGDT